MGFTFTPHHILPEVIIIESKMHVDSRGGFSEVFRADEFEAYGIPKFVQENHSVSHNKVARGLHYQVNKSQGKLVKVVSGMVDDYAVDIRRDSPNYGKYAKITLWGDDSKSIYIPPYFAHGFIAYADNTADFFYKVTDYYSQEDERSINFRDPEIGIKLPEGVIMTEKDENAPMLKDSENDFEYHIAPTGNLICPKCSRAHAISQQIKDHKTPDDFACLKCGSKLI